jgi:hypothetical protein
VSISCRGKEETEVDEAASLKESKKITIAGEKNEDARGKSRAKLQLLVARRKRKVRRVTLLLLA